MKIPFLTLMLVASLGIAHADSPVAGSVKVSGDVTKPRLWTLDQLQKLGPIQSIKTTFKGTPYTARGVSLWALIDAAAPKLDPTAKHSDARFVVLARGRDGYLASFALPELMPAVGAKSAYLIWEANGKPLSAKEGQFRLAVPDDKKPMRWVYDIVGLEIYDGKRLSPTPAAPKIATKP